MRKIAFNSYKKAENLPAKIDICKSIFSSLFFKISNTLINLHFFQFLSMLFDYYSYLELNRSMSTLDDDVICEGKYEIERMGYRYPAKLSNLFTSSQRRLKGTYKKQEQSFLHDLLKAL